MIIIFADSKSLHSHTPKKQAAATPPLTSKCLCCCFNFVIVF